VDSHCKIVAKHNGTTKRKEKWIILGEMKRGRGKNRVKNDPQSWRFYAPRTPQKKRGAEFLFFGDEKVNQVFACIANDGHKFKHFQVKLLFIDWAKNSVCPREFSFTWFCYHRHESLMKNSIYRTQYFDW
jgi:hypothetical protein